MYSFLVSFAPYFSPPANRRPNLSPANQHRPTARMRRSAQKSPTRRPLCRLRIKSYCIEMENRKVLPQTAKQPLISWKVSIDYFPTKWVFFRPNSYNMTLYNFPTQ